MNKIGIITKLADERAMESTQTLALWLKERDVQVTITQEIAEQGNFSADLAAQAPQDALPEGQDLIVVIGGDGTFIAAARAVDGRDVPLLGVNMGRLGFLTEVTTENMLETMVKVLEGSYRVEERMQLAIEVRRQDKVILRRRLLNDMVAHKGELARMVEFRVAIDGQFVFSSRADGLIISTPTGSTAYALSAGGPIIHPSLDALLLVPICPHTLTNRPIAVPGRGKIEVTMTTQGSDQQLTLDGQVGFPIETGDHIHVRRSNHRLRILHAPDRNYYEILRRKLSWGQNAGS